MNRHLWRVSVLKSVKGKKWQRRGKETIDGEEEDGEIKDGEVRVPIQDASHVRWGKFLVGFMRICCLSLQEWLK